MTYAPYGRAETCIWIYFGVLKCMLSILVSWTREWNIWREKMLHKVHVLVVKPMHKQTQPYAKFHSIQFHWCVVHFGFSVFFLKSYNLLPKEKELFITLQASTNTSVFPKKINPNCLGWKKHMSCKFIKIFNGNSRLFFFHLLLTVQLPFETVWIGRMSNWSGAH